MDTIVFQRNINGLLTHNALRPLAYPIATTVGVFDGVHKGHRFLIEQLREEAASRGLPSAVITFDRPPAATVRPGHKYEVLNSHREQTERLSMTGVDFTLILPFDSILAGLSAGQFMGQILREQLGVSYLLMGYDHQFGHPEVGGGTPDYISLGRQHEIHVAMAPPALDNEGVAYSSSRIRHLLREGKIATANHLLGYPYRLSGWVVPGDRIGRTFGFPTANIALDDPHKLIPPNGVYAAVATLENKRYPGMLYIGKRPTIERGLSRSIEINLFDFDRDIYGKSLSIELLTYTRGEQHFHSKDELVACIRRDETIVRDFFALHPSL